MTVRGTLKADGIAVAQITIDFLTNPIKVSALAAFVVAEELGQPIGWSRETTPWSAETTQRIRDLRDAMERDLGRHLFTGGSGGEERGVKMGSGSGLGELLKDDTPSV